MDIWVVAAAAGAGYVAQRCKNLRKGGQNLSDSSCRCSRLVASLSSQIKRIVQDKTLPPDDAIYVENLGEECYSEREPALTGTSLGEMASTGKPYHENSEGFGNCFLQPSGTFLNGLNNDDSQGNGEEVGIDGVKGGVLTLPPPTREIIVSSGFTRRKRSLMCRRTNGQTLKPLSSLESCVMAQFYKEQAEMNEYTINSTHSPHTPSISPLLVTSENSAIGRTMSDPFGLINEVRGTNFCMETCSQEKTSTSGVPPLPSNASKEFRRKSMSKTRTVQGRKLSYSNIRASGKGHRLQGSSDEALIFFLGVSFGIMSSLWANKQELDKLNGLLRQSENLVQDLQEELEMKESLTVEELTFEQSQDTDNDAFSLEVKQDNYRKEQFEGKKEEESFSKIEAELEAELERLEFNMSACGLGGKPADMVEFDADYVPDMFEGELRVLKQGGNPQYYADLDGSGSSPNHPANYAVSPWELSLRLHEVIQSRLENRVRELETALEKRQRKDRYMESEHANYWREFSNSNSGSSSIQSSPVLDAVEQYNHRDQSSFMKLQGDARDAYSEAHGNIIKREELEDQERTSRFNGSYKEESPKTFDQYTWIYDARLHNSIQRNSFADEKPLFFPPLEKRRENGILSRDFITSGDESEDGSEEMEKLLIQHIVEKARKGSPAVLNAQKMLFSTIDDQS